MTQRPRFVSLLGLGFGDCGKGLFTDFLCRHWQAHTVVRFNGGAQAGHNVVLPDGRHHTFSQFGAGTFVPGVATILAYPVIVHPTALLVEAEALQAVGVQDALQRIMIDARCRVTTPYHQAAGRLRELERGQQGHGTCGVGVGETVRHGLDYPEQVLHYGDLPNRQTALTKLDMIRQSLCHEFDHPCRVSENQAAHAAELQILRNPEVARHWLTQVQCLTRIVVPASQKQISGRLSSPGTVLFEGAQGVLLDEWYGFHPHTTWSSIHPDAVEAVVHDAGLDEKVQHFGILRAYMTRHGNGPFPTRDADLDCLPEPHNASDGWQGRFRRGHPDGVLLRYALSVAGRLDGLLVSHLDVFSRGMRLKWCDGYEVVHGAGDDALCVRMGEAGMVTGLRCGQHGNLAHQASLSRLLHSSQPHYAAGPIKSHEELIYRLEQETGMRVHFGSFGPSHSAVKAFPMPPIS